MTPKGYKFHDDVLVLVEKVGPTQSAELRTAASRTIGRWELCKRRRYPPPPANHPWQNREQPAADRFNTAPGQLQHLVKEGLFTAEGIRRAENGGRFSRPIKRHDWWAAIARQEWLNRCQGVEATPLQVMQAIVVSPAPKPPHSQSVKASQ